MGLEAVAGDGTENDRREDCPGRRRPWTSRSAPSARAQGLKAITGKMSPRAKREFEALGWKVHEGIQTATAQ